MFEFISNMIKELLIAIPVVVCFYIPLRENIKLSHKRFWITAAFFLVGMIFFTALAAHIKSFGFRWTRHIFYAVYMSVIFAFCYSTLKLRLPQLLYTLFVAATYLYCVCCTVNHLEARFFPEYFVAEVAFYFNFIHAVLMAATMPFVLLFFRKYVKPAVINSSALAWKNMWVIPFLFIVVISIFTGTYDVDRLANWQYIVIIVLLTVSSFMIYYVVIRMVIQTEKNATLSKSIAVTERQLELQGEHYAMLQTHIEETKRARHDLRHHLSVFQSYIGAGETEKLAAYVNEYRESLLDAPEITFCENFAVNSILRYYAGIAKNEGIRVDVHTELSESTGVSDSDLCIIFGNCIENAIEACRRLDGDKFIKINSKTVGKMLVITFDNSFDGIVKCEGGAFLSRKHEGEGIGISSVKAVAQKYGMSAQFEVEGNVFLASVILRVLHPVKS
jgi:hypothetical protein